MGAAVQLLKTRGPAIAFELARRPVPTALLPYVRSWAGYVERTEGPLRRRELPAPEVVLIIEFGPPIQVFQSGSDRQPLRYPGGFVAGLDHQYTLTEHDGYQTGMELKLTPLGARTLFGVPMRELTGLVVPLADLLPRAHHSLADRLESARNWDARFDILERLLIDAVRAADGSERPAMWAAAQIEAASGKLEIGTLCRTLGYSHKHVLTLFREDVGLSPKLYARLVRFSATVRELRARGHRRWAELAFEQGYSDQSHLVRELKHFSGLAPTELMRVLLGYPI
jgi:AraC-like DNA-binding protein